MPALSTELRGLTLDEVKSIANSIGEKPYRGLQVFQWLHDKAVRNWEQMTNISPNVQEQLAAKANIYPLRLLQEQISRDGTRKQLWQLRDGQAIESVLLHHEGDITRNRYTLCISTQVGCPMGCGFCATAKLGFIRNLSTAEIVSQVLDTTAYLRQTIPDFKISNVVYMGMGEPLLNLPAVLKSIKILNHKDGQNIGIRRITVSTCGLVPQIDELAAEKLDLVLAISLHAPNNALRNKIMPVNKQYPLEELLSACRRYVAKTGRRITMEYTLIKDFNDQPQHARELVQLLSGLNANVNLIPINESSVVAETLGKKFKRPMREIAIIFKKILQDAGVNSVIREEKGHDIDAACGQLAGSFQSR